MAFGSPINYAAKQQKGAGVVKWLLEKGADPRIRSSYGGEDAMDEEAFARVYQCEESLEAIRKWKKSKIDEKNSLCFNCIKVSTFCGHASSTSFHFYAHPSLPRGHLEVFTLGGHRAVADFYPVTCVDELRTAK